MPKAPPILSPELKAFVVTKYLADVPPRDIVAELDADFGVKIKASQLRQFLARSGAGRKKKEIEAKACALVSSARVNALAKSRAASPAAQLERWAEKSVSATDRAFALVDTASKPRELASAMAAASTGVRMFRLLSGLENSSTLPPGATRFDFNFSNTTIPSIAITPDGHTKIDFSPPGQPVTPSTDIQATETPESAEN